MSMLSATLEGLRKVRKQECLCDDPRLSSVRTLCIFATLPPFRWAGCAAHTSSADVAERQTCMAPGFASAPRKSVSTRGQSVTHFLIPVFTKSGRGKLVAGQARQTAVPSVYD